MEKSKMETPNIAVVRVRGMVNLSHDIKETFKHLNLYNKNWAIFINPSMMGMVNKVKDYVTWGEVSDEVLDDIITKRGEKVSEYTKDTQRDKYFEYNEKRYKSFFRLSPPKKGYGRKGVKIPFVKGGALGDRKNKINDLLKRMV